MQGQSKEGGKIVSEGREIPDKDGTAKGDTESVSDEGQENDSTNPSHEVLNNVSTIKSSKQYYLQLQHTTEDKVRITAGSPEVRRQEAEDCQTSADSQAGVDEVHDGEVLVGGVGHGRQNNVSFLIALFEQKVINK